MVSFNVNYISQILFEKVGVLTDCVFLFRSKGAVRIQGSRL